MPAGQIFKYINTQGLNPTEMHHQDQFSVCGTTLHHRAEGNVHQRRDTTVTVQDVNSSSIHLKCKWSLSELASWLGRYMCPSVKWCTKGNKSFHWAALKQGACLLLSLRVVISGKRRHCEFFPNVLVCISQSSTSEVAPDWRGEELSGQTGFGTDKTLIFHRECPVTGLQL